MSNSLLFDFTVDKENKTIQIKREFGARLELVWQAWTTAGLLDQWWGPKPWRAETRTMDFREGGHWLYAMVGPEGEKHWSRADFIEIIPGESFTQKDGFCNEDGVMVPDCPQNLMITGFTARDNKVLVNMLLIFDTYEDLEATREMGFEEGMAVDFFQLDELLLVLGK